MFSDAMISPFSPGLTTSFWVCVVVQPQDALTDLKWIAVLPVFSYLKCATACLSPRAGCTSTVFCSHFNSAREVMASSIDPPAHNATARRAIVKVREIVFIFSKNRSAQYNQPPRLAKSAVECRSTPDTWQWRGP